MASKQSKGISTLWLVVTVAVVGVLLVLVYFGKRTTLAPLSQVPYGKSAQEVPLSGSDEVTNIESDLNNTDVNFDSDFSAVDSDLQSI